MGRFATKKLQVIDDGCEHAVWVAWVGLWWVRPGLEVRLRSRSTGRVKYFYFVCILKPFRVGALIDGAAMYHARVQRIGKVHWCNGKYKVVGLSRLTAKNT
jgi:hypothetical protein